LHERRLTTALFGGNSRSARLVSNGVGRKEAPTLTTTGAEDAIDAMLGEGRSFSEIEDFISEEPISEELKSVLWLWAWAEQPRAMRRRIVPVGCD
jgi:hypothetical protein